VITFESSDPTITDVQAVLEWKRADSDGEYNVVYPTQIGKGKYAYKIDGLTSGNVTYETHIRFETEGAVIASYKLPFMTKRKPSVDWPYIYISNPVVSRKTGLVLHTVNTEKAAEITWTYDGATINTGADHKFHPTGDGTLKAVITWTNGSCDIITKKLTVIE
jgi:hypothetical protein